MRKEILKRYIRALLGPHRVLKNALSWPYKVITSPYKGLTKLERCLTQRSKISNQAAMLSRLLMRNPDATRHRFPVFWISLAREMPHLICSIPYKRSVSYPEKPGINDDEAYKIPEPYSIGIFLRVDVERAYSTHRFGWRSGGAVVSSVATEPPLVPGYYPASAI